MGRGKTRNTLLLYMSTFWYTQSRLDSIDEIHVPLSDASRGALLHALVMRTSRTRDPIALTRLKR